VRPLVLTFYVGLFYGVLSLRFWGWQVTQSEQRRVSVMPLPSPEMAES